MFVSYVPVFPSQPKFCPVYQMLRGPPATSQADRELPDLFLKCYLCREGINLWAMTVTAGRMWELFYLTLGGWLCETGFSLAPSMLPVCLSEVCNLT